MEKKQLRAKWEYFSSIDTTVRRDIKAYSTQALEFRMVVNAFVQCFRVVCSQKQSGLNQKLTKNEVNCKTKQTYMSTQMQSWWSGMNFWRKR